MKIRAHLHCCLPALASLVFLVPPALVGAQTLTGTVRDSASGRPLAGAVIVLGGRRANADTIGRFTMPALLPGTWRLSARALGYAPSDTMVTIGAYDTTRVQLALVRLGPLLDTVHVSATAIDVPGHITEFEARRLKKVGRYITREELRKADQRAFPDVLRAKFPNLGFEVGERSTQIYSPSQQAPGALRGNATKRCYVQIFLDGIPIFQMTQSGMTSEPPDVNQLLTQNFDAIEYYSGPSRTPPEFRTEGAMCGTLVLWSRRR